MADAGELKLDRPANDHLDGGQPVTSPRHDPAEAHPIDLPEGDADACSAPPTSTGEHALLGDLVARLSWADDGPVALVHAGAAQALFEAHVAEQNDLLLPAMGEVTGTAQEQAIAALHGHTCGCHDRAAATPELDARAIPHAIRHAAIFGALGAVAPAAELILVAPHDPLPLLHQIEQRWPSVFTIDYLERGPEAWRLRFTRAAAESVA